jgi:transposase-like protein
VGEFVTLLPIPPVLTELGPRGRKVARNEAIIEALRAGSTMVSVARRFGITPSRVREIREAWKARIAAQAGAVFVPLSAFDVSEIWTPERQWRANARPRLVGLLAWGEPDV